MEVYIIFYINLYNINIIIIENIEFFIVYFTDYKNYHLYHGRGYS